MFFQIGYKPPKIAPTPEKKAETPTHWTLETKHIYHHTTHTHTKEKTQKRPNGARNTKTDYQRIPTKTSKDKACEY